MIEIKINNSVEIAKSRSFIAKLLPDTLLHRRVEKAVAQKLQDGLAPEGVDAVVIVLDDES